jgi:hypothetical protein
VTLGTSTPALSGEGLNLDDKGYKQYSFFIAVVWNKAK